ncbi:MAG TPA: CAP domain-containing protein, partial [Anaeromyxobacteraceae bacterium]|nr:CAP domain-containing protein [Anaeromyxobacteraceae bacterium]
PSKPPSAQYGSTAGASCPTGGVMDQLKAELGDLAKESKGPAPTLDPRLCAMAEAFMTWKDPAALPPESVSSFASWYFGSPTPSLRILGAVLETGDARVIAERLVQPLSQFASGSRAPRFGLVAQTTTRGDRRAGGRQETRTRLVLAMQDAGVELTQPVPRQLPAGGTTRLEGKVLGDVARTTVLVGDPSGKLETIGPKDGPAFAADLKCGDKPGVLLVEVRGEQGAGATAAARFPIGCGVELPRSTPIPQAEAAVDPAASEKKLLDAVNALRASAGVRPLALDEAVAKVARDASQAQSRATGSAVDFDVAGALAKADVPSPLVLLNPAAAFTPDEAQWRLTTSPQHRSNMLNPNATHAGVGVVAAREGKEVAIPVYYVTELLVRELPVIDTEAMRGRLREAVATRRRDARAEPVKPDPLLEDVAQKYAAALASGKGKPPEQTLNDVVSPLYKAMRVVSVTAGTKLDPLEIVEEPGVASAGKAFGVGVAQGFNNVLGKNAVYVAIIVGARK